MTGPVTIEVRTATGSRGVVRVEVNPNAYHGDKTDPDMYIARFADASAVPLIGDTVTVVQPDDDPAADFVSNALVTDVDNLHGLITMRVDWDGFHDAPRLQPTTFVVHAGASETVNYYEAVLICA